ncbi:MAG TPA: NAD(P)-dependent oxidoreductase [Desulfarculaceae bacterium]|nr:NAD(P)-dependent oxidoreductase [Desulfarculaceae bacterium]
MARKILVTGACSQLGWVVVALLKQQEDNEVVALSQAELDILDGELVDATVERLRPATIINCAGFNDVEAAEHRLATKLPVNTRGLCNLARAAAKFKVYLCSFSSKYVFNGKNSEPYGEDDDKWPLNQYGNSKHGGEEMVDNLIDNYLIVRSDLLYGAGGNDWVSRIKKELGAGRPLAVSNDFFIAPTYIGDLAAAMVALSTEWAAGIYHYTNDAGNGVSCYEFAQAVAEQAGLDSTLLQPKPMTEIDFGGPLNLPERAILKLDRFEKMFPLLVRPWREALAAYMAEAS